MITTTALIYTRVYIIQSLRITGTRIATYPLERFPTKGALVSQTVFKDSGSRKGVMGSPGGNRKLRKGSRAPVKMTVRHSG